MAAKRTSTGASVKKIFCLLTISQLVLLVTAMSQCPKGSEKEKTCASCSRLPKARHFSDSCCSLQSAHDFCSNCLKNLLPCARLLTDLLTRRAPIMRPNNNILDRSDTKRRWMVESDIQNLIKERLYNNLFSKRVPEIFVPSPPVDEQKR